MQRRELEKCSTTGGILTKFLGFGKGDISLTLPFLPPSFVPATMGPSGEAEAALLRSNSPRNSRSNGESCLVFTDQAGPLLENSLFLFLKKPTQRPHLPPANVPVFSPNGAGNSRRSPPKCGNDASGDPTPLPSGEHSQEFPATAQKANSSLQ